MNTIHQLASDIVRIPSVTTHESDVANFIYETLLKCPTLTVEMQGENVVAYKRGRNTKKALIFNGHIDTVGVGAEEDWWRNPFSGDIDDGVLYGLGSSDMKAGIAGMMAIALQDSMPALDLWFSFVVGEEVDGRGSKSFVDWFIERHKANYDFIETIIAEPTDNSYIAVGHRGNAFVEIIIKGKSTHASHILNEDEDTILKLGQLGNILRDIDSHLTIFKHNELGTPTVAITSISGGNLNTPNKTPSSIRLMLDVRTTPSLHNKLLQTLNDLLDAKKNGYQINIVDECPAGWTDERSVLRDYFENKLNYEAKPSPGAADLCFFTEKGINTIIFGPGQRERMHAPNETVELAKIDSWVDTCNHVIMELS